MQKIVRELLRNPEVRTKIKEAAALVMRSGREVAIEVYKKKKKLLIWGPVVGGCEEIGLEHWTEYEIEMETPLSVSERPQNPIFSLHFHPESVGPIIPSEVDLVAAIGTNFPHAIAQVDWQGRITILVFCLPEWMQKLNPLKVRMKSSEKRLLEEAKVELEEIEKKLARYTSQKQILEELKNVGFEVSLFFISLFT